MGKKLFPTEIVEFTAEYHFNKHNPRTLIVYQLLLLLVIGAIASLFVVKIDVSVKGTGLLRAVQENHAIKAIVSGRVEEVFVGENQRVEAGQVLARIRTDILDQEKDLLLSQRSDLGSQLDDLHKLTRLLQLREVKKRPLLSSAMYSQQFTLFWQRVSKLQNQLELAEKNFERYSQLYDNRVISAAEYDEANYTYQQAKTELELAYDEQASVWQQDLTNLRLKTGELGARISQVNKEQELYVLQAPASGTLQSVKGLRQGSMISANEVLAEVSPDSGLIAEAYILPKDIGYLRAGTPVNLQIEAYDYNQWGMATGEIASISADIFTDRGQPYFKVRCVLNEDRLALKNGYEGKLHKGMTLQARFFVTRRTLFQLIYDKADDWLNPNIIAAQQVAR
ncbi:MAG TPA: HlyD family efflux transporter periplasmic adaptor subunit [Parapedobacter sp.]|uniref:HlyD family secretion protein n=1 Tax=Parapedobacter sp. TaxID=1958893 RepID=UPI002C43AA8D|nr:HlyD family efflux transporter periplasmic adaptor subunit [Parapedobacter sp.]HWK58160.1 HlyD family efflux transporter periplasmic adaptor subunit [Parapedobacter sp.]